MMHPHSAITQTRFPDFRPVLFAYLSHKKQEQGLTPVERHLLDQLHTWNKQRLTRHVASLLPPVTMPTYGPEFRAIVGLRADPICPPPPPCIYLTSETCDFVTTCWLVGEKILLYLWPSLGKYIF